MARARGGARRTPRGCLGDKRSRRQRLRLLAACLALLALPACPAWAAKWDLVPTLSSTVAHTDNVALAPDSARQSAWIAQLSPGLSVTATGARLRLNASYAPQVVYYDIEGQRDHRVFQQGNADLRAELAKRVLFVEAGGRVNQYDVSVQSPVGTSDLNISANRATVTTYYVSPYLVGNFGSVANGEARFTHSIWSADRATSVPDNDADRIDLRLASGPAYKRFSGDVRYLREAVNYEGQADSLTEVITVGARELVTPHVGLLAQAGHERYDFGLPGLVTEGSKWAAGLEWTPTTRTRLAATAGKRLDENAYSLDFRHRTRLTTWSAGYSEDVTSTRSEFFVPATASTAATLDQLFLSQYPDPDARQKAVQDFIARTGLPASLGAPVNFFTDHLFLVKRWSGSAALQGVRHVLIANAFRETRESSFGGLIPPGSGDFAVSDAVRQTGATLVWNWRVTARTAWNLSTAFARTEFLAADRSSAPLRKDDLTYVRLGLTRQLLPSQPRLAGSLYYRWQHNDSTESASS
jgi:uncharacterized protein (PEP-CTERM system associated)